jgi:HEAT repeat protein
MIATLRVDRMIKGRSDKPTLLFRFFIPDSLAYASIVPTQFGMYFLRETQQQEYVVLNPYYPFIVAAPEALTARGSDLNQVVAELAHVITSSRVSPKERSAAIAALDTVKTVAATAALRDAARNKDATLRIQATGALLRRNDISVMSMVENILLRPAESEKPMLGGLAFNLEGVKDPKAIPSLSRLLDAGDVQTRRGAAAALRNTGSLSAIEPLSKGLEDNDIEVRYSAVIGLAEITKQYAHGPAMDLYMQDEQRYLTYWRNWAKNRR